MKKGFTLIELLVVLVVIGVLVGLILPNMLQSVGTAHQRECAANLRSIDAAFQVCYAQSNNNWAVCSTTAQLVAGNFLEILPATCSDGLPYTVQGAANGLNQGFSSIKTTHFPAWPSLAGYRG